MRVFSKILLNFIVIVSQLTVRGFIILEVKGKYLEKNTLLLFTIEQKMLIPPSHNTHTKRGMCLTLFPRYMSFYILMITD